MSRICPNCNYVRKTTDSAPDWQCPSCQIAYNKGAGAANMENYGRSVPQVVKSTRSGSAVGKFLFLLVVLGAGVWAVTPFRESGVPAAAVQTGATQPEVILYATEWCGYCAATRDFFSANGIRFTELDTEKTAAGYEGYKKLGGNGVPLIVVGDKVIRGYNEDALRATLKSWLKRS
jgi:glutaredoxin